MGQAVTRVPTLGAKFVTKLLKFPRSPTYPRLTRRILLRVVAVCLLAALLPAGATPARSQDTATEGAERRAAVLARLSPDAAKRVFGLTTSPAPGPPRAIGSYTKGCAAGAAELPADGPNWQVMRPSRNRAWGLPVLIGFL